uniref:(northern house mosquito) hypothetical protein n=1 Tax=Culex pipiens TaxID=7175 RepID=A0A8D8BJM6_CULPI
MEVILSSHIARVVLAYLYDQKLNRAADEFCKASPYLKEERNCLKSGFRPAMYISFKLTDLFREYSEIQIKLNTFVEKYGNQLEIPGDSTTLKKIDYLLAALRKNRRVKGEPTAVGRKRKIPSPQPSLASSTPEVSEPKHKRICMNRSFIVLNESGGGGGGRNLSNLSHISPIGGETTQDSVAGDDESNKEEEEGEVRTEEDEQEMSQIDMWKQTLLENQIYPEKIADLINKERETSMNQQVGEVEVKEVVAPPVPEQQEVAKTDSQSFNFNLEDLISNIVNHIPVFEDMLEESKPEEPVVVPEETERPTTPVTETPLKARLRKTCKKNYANLSPLKKSCKKVKVISDVPFEGTVPEVLRSLKIDPAQVQPEVSSTGDQPIATGSNSATQYYVIQSDNTTKLVDINQLQFPTQQAINVGPDGTQSLPQTLIPIAGNGIPENTYFILDSQLPLVLGAYANEPQPEPVPAIVAPTPETLLSPDKFLIFPSSAPETNAVDSINTVAAPMANAPTTTASIISSISSSAQLIKQEVKTTPQNVSVPNPKARSASTPSRKQSHIRILNFHTPAKAAALGGNRIATPGSAPASVDNRRLPVSTVVSKLSNLLEEQEPSPSPLAKLAGDWDAVHGIGAITATAAATPNPNSVSNTPRVARKPCVRVLSRAASVEPPEAVPPAESPAPEVRKPTQARTPVAINPSDMEEWRRIRAVSKSNFDQHLRLVEEQKSITTKMLPRKKRPATAHKTKKKKKAAEGGDTTQDAMNESGETTIEGECSLTDAHAQMLEEALASARKKTPAKREEVLEDQPEVEDNAKIYVKIATPKKKAEAAAKASPRRKHPKGGRSAKKRRSGSARKKVVKKKEVVKQEEVEVPMEVDVPVEQEEKVASPKPVEPVEIKEPEKVESPAKKEPVKPEVTVPEVTVTPPEPPKAVKDHPKLLAKKSSAEYVRLEKEQQQQEVVPEPPEVITSNEPPPPAPSDFSFNVSALLETPFKAELENFPVTPRFLVPDPLQDTPITKIMRDLKSSAEGSSVAQACEIQTPNFPITPGLISTPKSVTSLTSPQSTTAGGFSSRRTDYSSGSSYYKPDESEDLDKNLETMLQNERRKRPPAAPEPLPAPEPEPVLAPEPHYSCSSSSSSSSSDSSESSSASSPETSPVKPPETEPTAAKPTPPLQLPSTVHNIFEMRRLQRAELEAKKQRTIARIKTTKMSPPPKRIERKFSGAPGFKARKVVVSRGVKEPAKKVSPKSAASQTGSRAPLKPVPPVPTTKTTTYSSSSSKRKNPTPRKVVYLEKPAPIPTKKHSPKRKPTALPEHTRKSPRTTQPKTSRPIEGTYESENLSRLCCTPDPVEPTQEEPLPRKQVYAFKSPERTAPAEEVPVVTPDSNKENLSTERIPDDAASSSGEEEDEDDDWTIRSVAEDSTCYFRFQHDEKKRGTTTASPSSRVIKKCNVVLDGRKICIQPQDAICLFEQEPQKAAGSPKKEKKSSKSSSKPSKKSSKEPKKPEPPPPPAPTTTPAPTTPSIKAKINVVSAVRTATNPITGKRGNHQVQQRNAPAAAGPEATTGKSLLLRESVLKASAEAKQAAAAGAKQTTKGEKENGAGTSGATTSGDKVDSVSPSPKMPLKLDMKKKHQQTMADKKSSSATSGEKQASSEKQQSQSKEKPTPPAQQQPKEENSIDIAAILSHLHGS